jgi:hypothetical protein
MVPQINHGSAYKIIHGRLGFPEICARMVPKQLTTLHEEMHLDVCQHHLDCYETDSPLGTKHGLIIASRRVNG